MMRALLIAPLLLAASCALEERDAYDAMDLNVVIEVPDALNMVDCADSLSLCNYTEDMGGNGFVGSSSPVPEDGVLLGDTSECPDLYRQISTEPELDAQRRFTAGDRRFLAFYGMGLWLPGLSDERQNAVSEGDGSYVLLRPVGDAITEETCMSFHRDANFYATRFNERMSQLLDAAK